MLPFFPSRLPFGYFALTETMTLTCEFHLIFDTVILRNNRCNDLDNFPPSTYEEKN